MDTRQSKQALTGFLAFWSLAPLWFANLLIQRGEYEFATWLVATPAAILICIVTVFLVAQVEVEEGESE